MAKLETDKVTLEVNAPAAGVISEIVVKEGETVAVGAILGSIAEGQAAAAAAKPAVKPAAAQQPVQAASAPERASASQPAARAANVETLAPSVRRIAEESGIDPATVTGSGKEGRVTKGDMLAVIEGGASPSSAPISFGKIQAPPRKRRARPTRLPLKRAKSVFA